jgi:hypothetical protein
MDAAKTDDNIHGRCHFDSLTHAGLFLLERSCSAKFFRYACSTILKEKTSFNDRLAELGANSRRSSRFRCRLKGNF